jgi:hypothetical protein
MGGRSQVNVLINDKFKYVSGVTFSIVVTKTPANLPDLTVDKGATIGAILPNALVNITPKNGEIEVGVAAPNPGNGPGTLLTIPLRVDKSASSNGVYALSIQNLVVSVNGQDTTSASEGGTITVTGHKKGDANGDDKISVTDATAALRAALGLGGTLDDDTLAALDLNGDGKVTVSEVTQILRAALGLTTLDD